MLSFVIKGKDQAAQALPGRFEGVCNGLKMNYLSLNIFFSTLSAA